MNCNCGVRICEVVAVPPCPADGCDGVLFVRVIADEMLADFAEGIRVHRIFAGFLQLPHPFRRFFASRDKVEQTFQIARDQNIHRGGDGHMEVAVAVISSRAQEIGQNIVGV